MKDKKICPFFEICFLPKTLSSLEIPRLENYCRNSFFCCPYYRRYRRSSPRPDWVEAGT